MNHVSLYCIEHLRVKTDNKAFWEPNKLISVLCTGLDLLHELFFQRNICLCIIMKDVSCDKNFQHHIVLEMVFRDNLNGRSSCYSNQLVKIGLTMLKEMQEFIIATVPVHNITLPE